MASTTTSAEFNQYPISWYLSPEVSNLFYVHPLSSLVNDVHYNYELQHFSHYSQDDSVAMVEEDGFAQEWEDDEEVVMNHEDGEYEEGEDEEGSDPEFELSTEIVERFAHTELRRRQRRKEVLEKEKAKQEALAAELLLEKLTKDQKEVLYGKSNYNKELEPLEERLRSLFDRKKDKLRPGIWPELPLNSYPNKRKSRAAVINLIEAQFNPPSTST